MSIEIYQEINIFVRALILGMMLCIIYDCLRIGRRIIKRGTIIIGIQDIIFLTFSAIVIFVFLYKTNGGIIRIYIFIAILVGAFVYEEGIGKYVVKYVTKISKKCFRLLKKCFQPIKIVFNNCKKNRRGALVAKERKKTEKKGSE